MGIRHDKDLKRQKVMKIFLKTVTVGNYYNYCIYRITDSVGRSYYTAEPVLHGVSRTAETEKELYTILEHDAEMIKNMQLHIR